MTADVAHARLLCVHPGSLTWGNWPMVVQRPLGQKRLGYCPRYSIWSRNKKIIIWFSLILRHTRNYILCELFCWVFLRVEFPSLSKQLPVFVRQFLNNWDTRRKSLYWRCKQHRNPCLWLVKWNYPITDTARVSITLCRQCEVFDVTIQPKSNLRERKVTCMKYMAFTRRLN